jgi:GTP-binding protein
VTLRNIAIIAHVDHGKTTLVDGLLSQSGTFHDNQRVNERAMDVGDLERERGITIMAKCTSVEWGDVRINIVDTPGHADFGGEVERILSMVDGVLLLVDAAEGPMPQTKFVLAKALAQGLRPIVVINKVDRADGRIEAVHEEVFDLFAALDATEEQLDFPLLYASAKQGWAGNAPDDKEQGLTPLFQRIVEHTPQPRVSVDDDFSMLVTTLESDPFLGRVLTGRIQSGAISMNETIKALNLDGVSVEQTRVTKILSFRGLKRTPLERAEAGDIVAIAGFREAGVSDTLCALEVECALAADPVDPPTLSMNFAINDSPLAGQEGSKVTSRMIWDRLQREAEGNVSVRVEEDPAGNGFEVSGRGELQLGVLIETMRREGFELSIGRPRVLFREDSKTGQKQEPLESVQIDVDEAYSGVVVESMSLRKGTLQDMRPSGGDKVRLTFLAPSRGLIGYHGLFMTETRGTGVMNRLFHGYGPYKGDVPGRRNGVLVSNAPGNTVAYGLEGLEDRGALFIGAGVKVYEGMVIGEHSRGRDLEVNPMKAKQLTNIRASGTDDNVRLTPARRFSLEQAIAYIEDDELVEVTPHNLRMRKRLLSAIDRKRESRKAAAG